MDGGTNNWQDAGRNGRSYLLRCWQEGDLPLGEEPGTFTWRFALVPIDDQSNARGFAYLEDLFGYLHGQLVQAECPAKNQEGYSPEGSKLSRLEISTRREENEP